MLTFFLFLTSLLCYAHFSAHALQTFVCFSFLLASLFFLNLFRKIMLIKPSALETCALCEITKVAVFVTPLRSPAALSEDLGHVFLGFFLDFFFRSLSCDAVWSGMKRSANTFNVECATFFFVCFRNYMIHLEKVQKHAIPNETLTATERWPTGTCSRLEFGKTDVWEWNVTAVLRGHWLMGDLIYRYI